MERIILQRGEWRAEVCPDMGANTVSLRYRDTRILHEPESPDQFRVQPEIYGIPPLFVPNRTAGGNFAFDGREYQLPINEPARGNHLHGLLHHSAFRVMECSLDTLQCVVENKAELFPFPFQLHTRYSLCEDGYRQDFAFSNIGDTDMPLFFGLHAAFAAAPFQVPLRDCWEVDDAYIPTGRLLDLVEEQRAYCHGYDPAKGIVSGFYRSAGNTAHIGDYIYTVSEGFTQWILYNRSADSGFVCLEPQSGPVNGLNLPGGAQRLSPGKQIIFSTHIARRDP